MNSAFFVVFIYSSFLAICRYFKIFSLGFLTLLSGGYNKAKSQSAHAKNFKTPSLAKRYFVIYYNVFLLTCFVLLGVVKNFFQYSRKACDFTSCRYVSSAHHSSSPSSVRLYELFLLYLKKSFRPAMFYYTSQLTLVNLKTPNLVFLQGYKCGEVKKYHAIYDDLVYKLFSIYYKFSSFTYYLCAFVAKFKTALSRIKNTSRFAFINLKNHTPDFRFLFVIFQISRHYTTISLNFINLTPQKGVKNV